MEVEETIATFEQLREGDRDAEWEAFQWIGNKRLGTSRFKQQVWVGINLISTLENYKQVCSGKDFEYKRPDGTVEIIPGDDFVSAACSTAWRFRSPLRSSRS